MNCLMCFQLRARCGYSVVHLNLAPPEKSPGAGGNLLLRLGKRRLYGAGFPERWIEHNHAHFYSDSGLLREAMLSLPTRLPGSFTLEL